MRLINETAARLLNGGPVARRRRCWARCRRGCSTCSRPGASQESDRRDSTGEVVSADGGTVIRPHFVSLVGDRARAGAGVPRGHQRRGRARAAVEARLARPAERQHRARDPQPGGRDEPRGAAAARIAGPRRGRPPPHRHHREECGAGEPHHRERAAAVAARDDAAGAHRRCRRGSGRSCRNSCATVQAEPASFRLQLDGGADRGAVRPDAPAPGAVEPLRQRAQARGRRPAGAGRAAHRPDRLDRPAVPRGRRTAASASIRPMPSASSSRSSPTSAGGTGLGLFISRELCQTNGALLAYESRPGGGSIFRIIFADPQRWE